MPRTNRTALALSSVLGVALIAQMAAPAAAESTTREVSTASVTAGLPMRLFGFAQPAPLNGSNEAVVADLLPKGCFLDADLDVNSGEFYHTVHCPMSSRGGAAQFSAHQWDNFVDLPAAYAMGKTTIAPKAPAEGTTVPLEISSSLNEVGETLCQGKAYVRATAYSAGEPGMFEYPKPVYGMTLQAVSSKTVEGKVVKKTGKATTNRWGEAWIVADLLAGGTVTVNSTKFGPYTPTSATNTPTVIDCTGLELDVDPYGFPTSPLQGAAKFAVSLDVAAIQGATRVPTAASVKVQLNYTDPTGAAKTLLLGKGNVYPQLLDMPMGYGPYGDMLMLPGTDMDKPFVLATVPPTMPAHKDGTTPEVVAIVSGTGVGSTVTRTVTLGAMPEILPVEPNLWVEGFPAGDAGSPGAIYTIRGSLAAGMGPESQVAGETVSIVLRKADNTEIKLGSFKTTEQWQDQLEAKVKPAHTGTLVAKVKANKWHGDLSTELGVVNVAPAITVAATLVKPHYNLSATLKPVTAGVTVTFVATSPIGEHVTVGTATTNEKGIATLAWTPSGTGDYTITASSASSSNNAAGTSAGKIVKVASLT